MEAPAATGKQLMDAALHILDRSANLAARDLASDLLFQEAEALDTQDWAGWLALYREDAEFWMPAWLDEDRHTSNPKTQVSLIYHEMRWELEERVYRLKSRKSVTAMPLPRTVHVIGGLRTTEYSENQLQVRSNATVHVYDPRTADHHISAVKYNHTFSRKGDGPWLIDRKHIVLINDRMPSVVDFYTV
jgi:3-phenylpropionate/cinnamic acid dioxygenase small subunit